MVPCIEQSELKMLYVRVCVHVCYPGQADSIRPSVFYPTCTIYVLVTRIVHQVRLARSDSRRQTGHEKIIISKGCNISEINSIVSTLESPALITKCVTFYQVINTC